MKTDRPILRYARAVGLLYAVRIAIPSACQGFNAFGFAEACTCDQPINKGQ